MKFEAKHLHALNALVQPQLQVMDHACKVIRVGDDDVLVMVLRVSNPEVSEPFDLVFMLNASKAKRLGIDVLALAR